MKRDKSIYRSTFKIIGKNIRIMRECRNISQEELAFKISSTRNYIGCIERAEKFPSIVILVDIAKALKCTLNDIFLNT